jgi:hypothetical protein
MGDVANRAGLSVTASVAADRRARIPNNWFPTLRRVRGRHTGLADSLMHCIRRFRSRLDRLCVPAGENLDLLEA